MSLWRRFVTFLGVKANAGMDRLEDPRETLELAYQKQLGALQDARRGVAEVLTSEKRLELEAESLRNNAERHAKTAAEAASLGNDPGARAALEREAFVNAQRDRLMAEIADVRAQRRGLEDLALRIQQRTEMFRTEKIALGARYAAAKATSRAGETVTGLSDDMEDVVSMVGRARDKAVEAQARAAALMQLAGSGDTSAATRVVSDNEIEARLAALKSVNTAPRLPESTPLPPDSSPLRPDATPAPPESTPLPPDATPPSPEWSPEPPEIDPGSPETPVGSSDALSAGRIANDK